jgi:Tol biopolymer transport system component
MDTGTRFRIINAWSGEEGDAMRVHEPGFAAAALFLLPACETDMGEGDQPPVHTIRVSETLDGTQANGDCHNPAVSADGRFVAFDSEADLLTPDDANGFRDILLKDRSTGRFENVTLVEEGTLLNGPAPNDCYTPAVSADGRFVAFSSEGYYRNAVVPGGGTRNIWRCDRSTGGFRAVLDDPDWPAQSLSLPSLSDDGRYVAFVSAADNLVAGVACGGNEQVWVADFATDPPTVVLVSRDKDAPLTAADGPCGGARISGDGSAVVFYGQAANLHDETDASRIHVYLGTPAGGAVEVVSRYGTGAPLDGNSSAASVSADGSVVAFQSHYSTGLPETALVVRDRLAGTLVVAADDAGRTGSQPLAFQPCSISADGRRVAYASGAMGGTHVIRLRDLDAAAPVTVSVHLSGTLPILTCANPALSADGRWVVWESKDRTLVTDDTNGLVDIFIRGPLR